MADPGKPFSPGGNPNHLLPVQTAKRAGEKRGKFKPVKGPPPKVFDEPRVFPLDGRYKTGSSKGNKLNSKLLEFYGFIAGCRHNLFEELLKGKISQDQLVSQNSMIRKLVKMCDSKRDAVTKAGGNPVPVPEEFKKDVA